METAMIGQGVQWRGRTGTVLNVQGSNSKVRFDDDDDLEEKTILTTFLSESSHIPLPVKLRKRKGVDNIDNLLQMDPEAVPMLPKFGPDIRIYCQPSTLQLEAKRGHFCPSYIKSTSELSHGAKYDIRFSKPVPEELMKRIARFVKDVDVNNNRICSRELALELMDHHGIKPHAPAVI